MLSHFCTHSTHCLVMLNERWQLYRRMHWRVRAGQGVEGAGGPAPHHPPGKARPYDGGSRSLLRCQADTGTDPCGHMLQPAGTQHMWGHIFDDRPDDTVSPTARAGKAI